MTPVFRSLAVDASISPALGESNGPCGWDWVPAWFVFLAFKVGILPFGAHAFSPKCELNLGRVRMLIGLLSGPKCNPI